MDAHVGDFTTEHCKKYREKYSESGIYEFDRKLLKNNPLMMLKPMLDLASYWKDSILTYAIYPTAQANEFSVIADVTIENKIESELTPVEKPYHFRKLSSDDIFLMIWKIKLETVCAFAVLMVTLVKTTDEDDVVSVLCSFYSFSYENFRCTVVSKVLTC